MKTKFVNTIILTVCFLLTAMPLLAQPPSLPSTAPIDGGLSLLIAGGIGYGVKKMRDKKKINDEK